MMFCTDNTFLLLKVAVTYAVAMDRSFIMLRAGSMSREVNNAVTL